MLTKQAIQNYIAMPSAQWQQFKRLSTVYQKRLVLEPDYVPPCADPIHDSKCAFRHRALNLARFIEKHPDAWMKLEAIIQTERAKRRATANLRSPERQEQETLRKRKYMREYMRDLRARAKAIKTTT